MFIVMSGAGDGLASVRQQGIKQVITKVPDAVYHQRTTMS